MKGKKKSYSLDFGGVEKEIRKRTKHIPEGDYVFKIISCERKKKEGGDSYYFSWKFMLIEDARGGKKQAGMTFYYITSLKPEALFNLRNLINAATEKNVSGKQMNFDPSSLYGKKIGGTVEDEEYEGKIRSKVVDVMPLKDIVEGDDEDEDDDDVEDEDDDSDDEDDDADSDDDDDDDDEDEEEPEPVKKKGKKDKDKGKGKGKKKDDLDEVDEDEI